MKKAIMKTVINLSHLVGHKIIRTKETAKNKDFSYTKYPLILKGFTEKGEMIVQYEEGTLNEIILGSEEFELPLYFTDRNWKIL